MDKYKNNKNPKQTMSSNKPNNNSKTNKMIPLNKISIKINKIYLRILADIRRIKNLTHSDSLVSITIAIARPMCKVRHFSQTFKWMSNRIQYCNK